MRARENLKKRTESAISASVEFQQRNGYGIEQFNARLVQSLMEGICDTLSELHREGGASEPLTQQDYQDHFKAYERRLRDEGLN